jgi:hypothetical protein
MCIQGCQNGCNITGTPKGLRLKLFNMIVVGMASTRKIGQVFNPFFAEYSKDLFIESSLLQLLSKFVAKICPIHT